MRKLFFKLLKKMLAPVIEDVVNELFAERAEIDKKRTNDWIDSLGEARRLHYQGLANGTIPDINGFCKKNKIEIE